MEDTDMSVSRVIYDSYMVCGKAYVVPDYILDTAIQFLNDDTSHIASWIKNGLWTCKGSE